MNRFRIMARLSFIIIASLYILLTAVYWVVRLAIGDGYWLISLANSFAYLAFVPLVLLLPLALKLRTRWVLWGMLPVVVVALVWFIPYFVPKTYAAPTGTSLRILTLNVWGNNHDLTGVEQWVRESGADVVLLQEVSPAYASDHLPRLEDVYPYQSSQQDRKRWGDNMTLSRYPILSADYVDLHVPNQPAPVRLVVDVQGSLVAIYNVHLAWPVGNAHLQSPTNDVYSRVLFGFDDRQRNAQIANLLQFLKTEPYPYIIGGDFNTSDFSATYGRLAAQMHDSFKEGGFGLGGSWPVARARGLPGFLPPLIRIDYIWHSDALRTVNAWQGAPVGSDHLPLFATLELVS